MCWEGEGERRKKEKENISKLKEVGCKTNSMDYKIWEPGVRRCRPTLLYKKSPVRYPNVNRVYYDRDVRFSS